LLQQHVVELFKKVKPLKNIEEIKIKAIRLFEDEYLAKILGFCCQKVNTREEAEDLASEIALEVLKVFFNIPDGVFTLCREIIKNNIETNNLSEEQKYLFSIALQKKLFLKDGDTFKHNYYFIERDGLEKLSELAVNKLYPKVKKLFNTAYQIVLDEYKETVPKHLHWQMGNFLSNHLN